jgi:4-aminobutyrate aminotransferase-like enzyme
MRSIKPGFWRPEFQYVAPFPVRGTDGEFGARVSGAVRGPYGCGMMWAWTPYDVAADTASKLVEALFQAGLMSFVCGDNPTRIRFLPPPGITHVGHLDAAMEILRSVLWQLHGEYVLKVA